MIFAVFDPSPLTQCINCSFLHLYLYAPHKKRGCKKQQRLNIPYNSSMHNNVFTHLTTTLCTKTISLCSSPLTQCINCSFFTFISLCTSQKRGCKKQQRLNTPYNSSMHNNVFTHLTTTLCTKTISLCSLTIYLSHVTYLNFCH